MAEFGGGPKTGSDNYLYYNAGTRASGTYVVVDEVVDISMNGFTRNVAELKRRANDFTKGLPAKIGLITISVQLVHGLNETVYDVIRAALLAGTVQEWVIYNGPIATVGQEGWGIAMFPSGKQWEQPLEDVSMQPVELTSGYLVEGGTEIDPEWQTTTT